MGKLYANAPIIEALCEFRFVPNQPWDWTIPGLMYDKVKAEFPKKQQQNLLEVELHAEQQEIAPSVKGGVARMQFLREDKSALIQVGPDLLVVNHLKPYSNWQVFKNMIANSLAIYREVASPKSLARIGLRYINRIEIPSESVQIEDYVLAVPQVPQAIPQVFVSWIQRVEIPYESVNGLLALQSGQLRQAEQKGIAFLFDFDFITDAQSLTLDTAMDWVEQAHEQVELAFEACITDRARNLFKEVNHGQ